jgi:hypothetical protein
MITNQKIIGEITRITGISYSEIANKTLPERILFLEEQIVKLAGENAQLNSNMVETLPTGEILPTGKNEVTGLQRAINANKANMVTPKPKTPLPDNLTGLQRAIKANQN